MFEDGQVQALLENSFEKGISPEFIMVVADYTSPTVGSLYENSTTSGRWIDYTLQEVIPFVDENYRTLPHKDSRAIAGDFMGGRGALLLAFTQPDTFSCVYALHPVATGNGHLPWSAITVDWQSIHRANSFEELPQNGRERIFTAISQATLPNPDRPPFFCDFPVEILDGESKSNPENTRRAQQVFHIDEYVEANLENIRALRAIGFEWGRFDPTTGHVVANRSLSRLLADLGVEHEAEEHNGGTWDRNWIDDGRFATRLLPFLAKHLETDLE